jgi:hypothetical protein
MSDPTLNDTQKQILRDAANAPDAPGPRLAYARYRKTVLVRAGETRWETSDVLEMLLALESIGLVRRLQADATFLRPKSRLTTGFLENPKEYGFFELTDEGKRRAG